MYECKAFRSYNQKTFRDFDIGKISKSIIQTDQIILNHLCNNFRSIYGVPTSQTLCRAVGDARICEIQLFPGKVYNLKSFYWYQLLYFRKYNFIFSICSFCDKKLYYWFWIFFSFFKDSIYFQREGKGGRETSMCGCLSRTPYWGPGPQQWKP